MFECFMLVFISCIPMPNFSPKKIIGKGNLLETSLLVSILSIWAAHAALQCQGFLVEERTGKTCPYSCIARTCHVALYNCAFATIFGSSEAKIGLCLRFGCTLVQYHWGCVVPGTSWLTASARQLSHKGVLLERPALHHQSWCKRRSSSR